MAELLRAGIDNVHKRVIHPLLTSGEAGRDREIAHDRMLKAAKYLQHPHVLSVLENLFSYDDPMLHTSFLGTSFKNPLGIAAGFDKNAHMHALLGKGLGFGHVTVGSVTLVPYEGNKRPRIFDLPEDNGLLNRMSFPGNGVEELQNNLEGDSEQRSYGLIVNIAASKPSFDRGSVIEDYAEAAKSLMPYGDIHEINVSSPNTKGIQELQDIEVFRDLAQALQEVYRDTGKPYLFKFSPDVSQKILEQDLKIMLDTGVSGISLTNTTTDPTIRANLLNQVYRQESGGISGAPLKEKALNMSYTVYSYTDGSLPIKRAGGIQTAHDMWEALTYGGAEVVDVYTAFVRPETSTPFFARQTLRDFTDAMRTYGMSGMEDFHSLKGQRVIFPSQQLR